MQKLGNWTTFDCPTKNEDEAFEFLKTKLNAIGASVKRKMNDHDFGPYPSFEIDIPDELADFDSEDDSFPEDVDNSEHNRLNLAKEKMIIQLCEIEDEFNKKFHSDDE